MKLHWPRDLAHPSHKFHRGGQKVGDLASFSHRSTEPPTFENAEKYLNSETDVLRSDDRPVSSSLSVVKFGDSVHAPLRTVRRKCPHQKFRQQKCAKSSTTQPRIIRFRSNFGKHLNTRHSKWCKSSRSRSQRSRLQRDRTYHWQKKSLGLHERIG